MRGKDRFSLLVVVALLLTATIGSATAHHNPRLFTNSQGDHGGTYPSRGRHTFFWLADEKRFDYRGYAFGGSPADSTGASASESIVFQPRPIALGELTSEPGDTSTYVEADGICASGTATTDCLRYWDFIAGSC